MTDVVRSRVFVSHAGRDLAWAEWVAWQLRDAGHEVELDRWDWATGDDFVVRMSQALDRAEIVVAVVSQAYFEIDRFTTGEWTAVLAARGRLVMLRAEDVTVTGLLRSHIHRDLFGLAEAEARRVVLQAVEGPAGPPRRAPGFPGAITGPAAPAPEAGSPRLPGALPPIWNVPIRNVVFTGRDAMLAALRDGLAGGSPLQALCGIGGVGKTTLAIEYAYRFANGYDLIWWIDAEQPDRIGEQMAALSVAAGWSPADADVPTGAAQARQRLRTSSNWLLVFDNADDPSALAGWLPPGLPGHVLVPSRNPNWWQLGTPTVVDVFARTESITLLRRLTPTISESDADRVAGALADLPLAVAQAAGLLTETGMNADQYLRALREQITEVLAENRPVDYPVSLAAAITVAVDRLAHEDPAAVRLARLCAVLAPEPIPLDIFPAAPAGAIPESLATVAASTVAFHRSAARLGRYGLARITDGTAQLHRLTQAILTADDPDLPATRRQVGVLLAAAVPDDLGNQPATWERWAQLLPHLLAADPAGTNHAGLRRAADNGVRYLLSRGEVHTAFRLAELFYLRRRERLGTGHVSVRDAADTLGRAYRALARYADAKRLDEETLDHRRELLGADDPATLDSANYLTNDLRGLGELEKAHRLDEDTLTRRRRILGDDHPDTLDSARSLAADLRELDDRKRA